jgi:NTE family protein
MFGYSQKVGVVLSGGAAKGIAHVGVLKALEENEIPIDYIVGTSMGGIIGGCYAAGMSPEEIERMVLSEQFLRWVNGASETGYNYFYHQRDVNPGFLALTLAVDSTLNLQFNSSIANDVSLNFALSEKMAQASAISGNNFDSLFVPFRVVASDIFTQNEVILSKGSLSEALRATQSVPFFYNPIRVDGKYLFDGGVYNNFPVDVAQTSFNPDVIIGVNVSTKIFDEYPFDSDDKLISKSLLFMLLDKSDPGRIPENGVYIQPDLKGFTSFDFGRAKSLIDSGYVQTMRQMDEIKQKVERRVTCDSICHQRNVFRDRSMPFVFGKLSFDGFNSKQRGYIRQVFKTPRSYTGPVHYSQIKKGYFRLVSESYFMNVFPKIYYDPLDSLFRLHLTQRPQQNFLVDFGGVIATRDISNIYLGLNYYWFNHFLGHAHLGVQTGSFYRAGIGKVRMDFATPFYLEPYIAFDRRDYLESEDVFKGVTPDVSPTILIRNNRRAGVTLGVPLKHSMKAFAFFEGYNNKDRYSNNTYFVSTDTLDDLRLQGFHTGIGIESNSLDRKQYPSSGRSFSLTAQYYNTTATLNPGSTAMLRERNRGRYDWFRARVRVEQYFGYGRFRPGYFLEAVASNQPVFQNHFGTLINAPAFYPLQDSRTLFTPSFRSFNFVGAGSKNVFNLRRKLDFRAEVYVFKPFDFLTENNKQETVVVNDFSKVFFAGSASLVYHSPIGPVSASLNYYDDERHNLGILVHVGFLLFQPHPME